MFLKWSSNATRKGHKTNVGFSALKPQNWKNKKSLSVTLTSRALLPWPLSRRAHFTHFLYTAAGLFVQLSSVRKSICESMGFMLKTRVTWFFVTRTMGGNASFTTRFLIRSTEKLHQFISHDRKPCMFFFSFFLWTTYFLVGVSTKAASVLCKSFKPQLERSWRNFDGDCLFIINTVMNINISK